LYCEILSKGTGTPVVFLHGFLGSGQDWRHVVSHLKGRTCLAYDLPGHGNTPWTAMEIEDLLASALPPQKVDLVGYSLGGRLAMRFALRHPHRIHSLTLLSTHIGLKSEEEKQQRLQADRVWAQKILVLPFDEFLCAWYDQPLFSSMKNKPALIQEIVSMRKTQRPKDLVTAMLNWSLGRQDCHRERLLKFDQPWRILYGQNDHKFSELFANMPNAHCIPLAGHAIHYEAPKEVAAYI
jgi:2-succinyl-6-hydroxy-2,4-cyclohexadiene-1-carboxylate synthase